MDTSKYVAKLAEVLNRSKRSEITIGEFATQVLEFYSGHYVERAETILNELVKSGDVVCIEEGYYTLRKKEKGERRSESELIRKHLAELERDLGVSIYQIRVANSNNKDILRRESDREEEEKTYDDHGNMIKFKRIGSDGREFTTHYKYDDQNRIIERTGSSGRVQGYKYSGTMRRFDV